MFMRVILIKSGKYRVDYLLISPNCHYILLSISESHGSHKTNFTTLKEKAPKNIFKKFDSNQNMRLVMTFDLNFMGYT